MNTINQNIVFIGFMGCGKSSVGRAMSKQLQCLFIDTDNLIENSENKDIEHIFIDNSEEYFREYERKVFDFLLPTKNTCISVGGGFPIYTKKPLSKIGVVVYLKKSFQDILNTLNQKDVNQRPLMKDINKAQKLYTNRLNAYSKQADITIDITANQSINDICLSLQNKLYDFTTNQ